MSTSVSSNSLLKFVRPSQIYTHLYRETLSTPFPSSCALGDMYNQEGDATEPEWVKTEREQFTEFRDKNKDGKMDKEETRDWILPSDYDHAEAEAKHLVYESDADKVRVFKDTVSKIFVLFPVSFTEY